MATVKTAARWALIAVRNGLIWVAAALMAAAEWCKLGIARLAAAPTTPGK